MRRRPRRRFKPRKKHRYRPVKKYKFARDNLCYYCGRKITQLPYRCRYCGHIFCPDHRLPETHGCNRLPSRHWPTPTQIPPEVVKPPYVRRHFRLPRLVKKGIKTSIQLLFIIASMVFLASGHLYPASLGLAIILGIYLDYKIFQVFARIRAHTEARLFGLKLLGATLSLAGVMLAIFWYFFVYYFYLAMPSGYSESAIRMWGLSSIDFIFKLNPPAFMNISVFVLIFSLGLLVVGAFLTFKFMRRAGIIIFPR